MAGFTIWQLICHYSVFAGLVVCALEFDISFIPPAAILALSVGYPMYRSWQVLEDSSSSAPVRSSRIRSWIIYFVVFYLFDSLHTFVHNTEFDIPLYHEVGLFFIIWLLLPPTQGGTLIYDRFLEPLFGKYHRDVDIRMAEQTQAVKSLEQLGVMSKIWSIDPAHLLSIALCLIALPFTIIILPAFISQPLTYALVCLAGVFVPAYFSLKALSDHKPIAYPAPGTPLSRLEEWLIYWLVFSLFHLVHEHLHEKLFWVPFWYQLETAFLFWLQLHFTQGAQKLYSALPFTKLGKVTSNNGPSAPSSDGSVPDDYYNIANINRRLRQG